MIPLAIGLGILGFLAMRRAHRRCHGGAYGWYGPWAGHRHHHHGRHRGYGRRPWVLHAALARIDATPAQERVIVGAIDSLHERLHGAKDGLHGARADLAAALRGPALDDAALGAVLGRVDATTHEARSAAVEALRTIHGVLDDTQRATLADLVDRGAGGGWWRGGPYR